MSAFNCRSMHVGRLRVLAKQFTSEFRETNALYDISIKPRSAPPRVWPPARRFADAKARARVVRYLPRCHHRIPSELFTPKRTTQSISSTNERPDSIGARWLFDLPGGFAKMMEVWGSPLNGRNQHGYSTMMAFASVGIRALLIIVCDLWLIGSSHAATITPLNSRCQLLLSGPIQAGDAAQLIAALQQKDPEVELSLCLHSGGGSFDEGVKLAQAIFENGVSTVVDDKQYCYSACAIAFMGGRRIETAESDGSWPSRTIHVGAKVGFHAPYLPQSGNFAGMSAQDIFTGAVVAMARLLSLSEAYSIPPSLLVEMAARGPNEVFLIDTIDKAGRWNIRVAGYRPLPVNKTTAATSCINAHAWSDFRKSLLVGDDKSFILNGLVVRFGKLRDAKGQPTTRYARLTVDEYNAVDCVFMYSEQGGKIDEHSSVSFIPSGSALGTLSPSRWETWYMFDPNTTFEQLAKQ